jgi:hypothetical protein
MPVVDDLEGRCLLSYPGGFMLLPAVSLPSLASTPLSRTGRFALPSGASPLPLIFSQAPSSSDGSRPDTHDPALAFLGRDFGMQLGHAPGLFPESAPLLVPRAQAPAASATVQVAGSADASRPDARETGSMPSAEVAAPENRAAGPPEPDTPPIVVPISAPSMPTSAALPVPSLGRGPAPSIAPRGGRPVPTDPTATGRL